ncbi:MAG: hypothetical protein KDC90_08055, partial [Ignavibacteriae bacterium]|nr:hypothetical protein [Ignavibacteriota bacterium]
MVIATFTSGEYTQIGVKFEYSKSFQTIESKILFQDPDKFVGRFQSILHTLFGIKILDKNCSLIFVISGIINQEKKEIIQSDALNEISFSKYYDGFSFVKAFGAMVSEKNIFLLNDSDCIALSHVFDANVPKSFPALSLYIGEKVGASLIKENGILNYNHVFGPIKYLGNKRANYLLGDRGIDNILINKGFDIGHEYTINLAEVLKDILILIKDDGYSIEMVFIHSTKSEYILQEELKNKFPQIDLHMTDGNSREKYLPLEGALNYVENMKQKKTIANFVSLNASAAPAIPFVGKLFRPQKIDYYDTIKKQVTTIKGFNNLVSHWRKTKPISLGNSYYIF